VEEEEIFLLFCSVHLSRKRGNSTPYQVEEEEIFPLLYSAYLSKGGGELHPYSA